MYMRALRQENHLGIEPPSRRATRHHHHDLFQKVFWACKQHRARVLSNDLLQCCALYCEPASLSAAPTDSRRTIALIFMKYIIIGWTNSPVNARSALVWTESTLYSTVKILPRMSVGGISVVSVVVVVVGVWCAVVDGSLDLSARATSFFI